MSYCSAQEDYKVSVCVSLRAGYLCATGLTALLKKMDYKVSMCALRTGYLCAAVLTALLKKMDYKVSVSVSRRAGYLCAAGLTALLKEIE